jgi:hypothetical protein
MTTVILYGHCSDSHSVGTVASIAARRGNDCCERLPVVLLTCRWPCRKKESGPAISKDISAAKVRKCCSRRWLMMLPSVVNDGSTGDRWCFWPEQRMSQVVTEVSTSGGP